MRYLLDANAFILLLTGFRAVVERAEQCEEGEIAISSIAFAEVAHGSENGKPPPKIVLEKAMTKISVLPFDAAAAQAYARLPFKRGSFDRLIAAHALATDLILVTANLGHFTNVPGLSIENWAEL